MNPAAGSRWLLVVVLGFLPWITTEAWARPVPVGRYVEIPYGVSEAHPHRTGRGDERRTGRSAARAPADAPSLAWETRLASGRPSAPALSASGGLFVATASGLTAIDPSGSVRFSERLGFASGTPSLTPTADVVVGTHAGVLTVISQTGVIRTRTLVGGAVRGSPLVLADGSILVVAFDQAAHRFDADGRRLFRAPLPRQVTGPAAWSTRGLLLVPAGNRLVALDLRGEIRTVTTLGTPIVAGPAVADDGSIWLLVAEGALLQLTPDGERRTYTELGLALSASAGIAIGRDGAVRVPTRGDALLCIGATGTERWRVTGEGGFLGGVTLDADDVALAVTDGGMLIAVDGEGQVRWRVRTGTRSDAAPVIGADGTVYVSTVRGTLQAWSPSAGR